MAGILTNSQTQKTPPKAALLSSQAKPSEATKGVTDPALQKIEAGVDAKCPPELKKQYLGIIVSGLKVMFDPSTTQYMQQHLQNSANVVQTISQDIPKLLLLIYRESKLAASKDQNAQATFIGAAMLAGRVLMCQALDYAEKSGRVQVTKDVIDQCTAALNVSMPAAFGITKDMIAQHLNGQGAAQPPTPPAAPTAAPAQAAPTGA